MNEQMLMRYVHATSLVTGWARRLIERLRVGRLARVATGERGQTTAEYALVILAAAAVALVLIAWARSSGRLPAFFDSIIDNITGDIE